MADSSTPMPVLPIGRETTFMSQCRRDATSSVSVLLHRHWCPPRPCETDTVYVSRWLSPDPGGERQAAAQFYSENWPSLHGYGAAMFDARR